MRDEATHCLIPVSAPTLNYDEVKNLLLSKPGENVDKIKEFEELLAKNNGSLLLDGKVEAPKAFFTSSLRSGNTFSRKLYEQIFGIASGSAVPNRSPHNM